MSDTRRWVQWGWDAQTIRNPPKSKKHQMRDRKSAVRNRNGNLYDRFQNHGKNCLYNLKRKNKQLSEKGNGNESVDNI